MNNNFKYLLFGFNKYGRAGGFNDFIFEFTTFHEFKNKLENIEDDKIEFQIFEIVDLTKLNNFQVLFINEDKDVNIKSKLKRAVRGYFAYDKTR